MKMVYTILAAGTLVAWAPRLQAETANGIEAIVDDSVITYFEVISLSESAAERLFRDYRNQPARLEEEINKVQKANLEVLVDRRLIMHEFKTAGYSLPETMLDEMVQDQIKADFGDRATATKTLEARGLTIEKYRQQIKERFIVSALRAKNISSEIIISPHKIETYYLAHRDDFKVEDEIKLRVIVLKVSGDPNVPAASDLAKEILVKLNEGASFAEMANLYSQGSQRGQGGDWGWYKRSQLTKGLADVAATVPVGKYSGVFGRSLGDDYWVYQYDDGKPTLARHYGVDASSKKQTLLEERHVDGPSTMSSLPEPREFYLLKVEETHPEHHQALSEVRENIERSLLDAEKNRLEKQWYDRLKKKTFVRTLF
jgi:peptidyl-prolyl cis-trans isomerase SurA